MNSGHFCVFKSYKNLLQVADLDLVATLVELKGLSD